MFRVKNDKICAQILVNVAAKIKILTMKNC